MEGIEVASLLQFIGRGEWGRGLQRLRHPGWLVKIQGQRLVFVFRGTVFCGITVYDIRRGTRAPCRLVRAGRGSDSTLPTWVAAPLHAMRNIGAFATQLWRRLRFTGLGIEQLARTVRIPARRWKHETHVRVPQFLAVAPVDIRRESYEVRRGYARSLIVTVRRDTWNPGGGTSIRPVC
jgi:hypothetical protein